VGKEFKALSTLATVAKNWTGPVWTLDRALQEKPMSACNA